MTSFDIVGLFKNGIKNIPTLLAEYPDDKTICFSIFLCETNGKIAYKSSYIFNKMECQDDYVLILKNRRNKVVKKLTKDNVVWLSGIYAFINDTAVLVSDLNCASLSEYTEEK